VRFTPTTLTEAEQALRDEVRDFLASELPKNRRPGLGMDTEASPEFSRRLAARGWLGMTIPRQYGGHERSAVERFVVIEELLAAGAPVAAHWVADRQIAPAILAFGNEAQRRRFLPAIARGDLCFSLGMSEPDAGSDLAAVKSRAVRTRGGWLLSGTKIWTSRAHESHFMVVLCRTGEPGSDRHDGLSQLIVDLSWPGVTVRPIPFLDGSHHFDEVALSEVEVPDDMVLGEPGAGWRQVTSELTHERSGPDRYMSAWKLIETFIAEHPAEAEQAAVPIGILVARYWAIHQMSLALARAMDTGASTSVQAAMVKDLGTVFEQEVVRVMQQVFGRDPFPGPGGSFESLLAQAIVTAPAYTLRGGTTEILRTITARALAR
jgi:alkylation response protein AidB-like acyl-CoA dehydrogenase